jgi:hypothetical protein
MCRLASSGALLLLACLPLVGTLGCNDEPAQPALRGSGSGDERRQDVDFAPSETATADAPAPLERSGEPRVEQADILAGQDPQPSGVEHTEPNTDPERASAPQETPDKPADPVARQAPPETGGEAPTEQEEAAQEIAREEAIAEIRKIGGIVRADEGAPDGSMVAVFLSRAQTADAGLECLKGLTNLGTLDLSNMRISETRLWSN